MDYAKEALRLHAEWKGKLDIDPKMEINTKDDLSLAYTPGVAAPCLEIEKDINKSYELTGRGNLVAVVTDGTAVLGLGDIGPEAGMPVMEGKCVLFKEFGGVNAIPLCIKARMWMKSSVRLRYYPAASAVSIWRTLRHHAALKLKRS